LPDNTPLTVTVAAAPKGAAESYLGFLYMLEEVAVYGYVTPLKMKIGRALALTDAVLRFSPRHLYNLIQTFFWVVVAFRTRVYGGQIFKEEKIRSCQLDDMDFFDPSSYHQISSI
jgi:hypothetical protein